MQQGCPFEVAHQQIGVRGETLAMFAQDLRAGAGLERQVGRDLVAVDVMLGQYLWDGGDLKPLGDPYP